jgi:hypothetical protein
MLENNVEIQPECRQNQKKEKRSSSDHRQPVRLPVVPAPHQCWLSGELTDIGLQSVRMIWNVGYSLRHSPSQTCYLVSYISLEIYNTHVGYLLSNV